METNDKLDKIIDLLVAQNNLLTSIMLSLRPSMPQPNIGFSDHNSNQFGKASNIKAEIEKRIHDARMEAQARIGQIQSSMPDFQDKLKD